MYRYIRNSELEKFRYIYRNNRNILDSIDYGYRYGQIFASNNNIISIIPFHIYNNYMDLKRSFINKIIEYDDHDFILNIDTEKSDKSIKAIREYKRWYPTKRLFIKTYCNDKQYNNLLKNNQFEIVLKDIYRDRNRWSDYYIWSIL